MPVKCKDPVDFAEYQSWFRKSMDAVNQRFNLHRSYEAQYNVKVHANSFSVVTQIEFPSEEEATLFMLRWG